MKKAITLLIFVMLLGVFCSCAQAPEATEVVAETRIFNDSAGRNVEIPAEVRSVAPTGPLSQVFLYIACPDMLTGISMDFSEEAKRYIGEKYYSLPQFGQFYGKNASLNMEALIAAAPDVIVDIGEAKENIARDMDDLQKQLGIPVVFIEATLDTMDGAFEKLGELTGETRLSGLAAYCRGAVDLADGISGSKSDGEKVRVYIAMGEKGLNTNAKDSFHADVLSRVGGYNVADIEASSLGGGSEVSFEQIMLWDPEVILAETDALYRLINADPAWRQINAVKSGRVYKIPSAPYNFVTNPPAANRILGLIWLGAILYPEEYGYDIEHEARFFFREFYSINLTDGQYREIMADAL